jgi:hypothetical protein
MDFEIQQIITLCNVSYKKIYTITLCNVSYRI